MELSGRRLDAGLQPGVVMDGLLPRQRRVSKAFSRAAPGTPVVLTLAKLSFVGRCQSEKLRTRSTYLGYATDRLASEAARWTLRSTLASDCSEGCRPAP